MGFVNIVNYNQNIYFGVFNNGWCYYFVNGVKFFNDVSINYVLILNYNEWVGCYFDVDVKMVGFIFNGIDRGIVFIGLIGMLYVIFGNGLFGKIGM